MPHDVLAGDIVATLPQHLHQQFGRAVAIGREDALLVAVRVIAIHEGGPPLHAFVIDPGRIAGLFERARRDHPPRVLDARGHENRSDRGRANAEQMNGPPAEFRRLPDRLGGEFRGCHVDQDIDSRRLHEQHLRVDGRISNIVCCFTNQHLALPCAKGFLQARKIVLAGLIVLVEQADLRVRMVVQDVACIDADLGSQVWCEPHGPWMVDRILEPHCAPADEELRDLAVIEVFLNRDVGRAPDRLEYEQYLVAFDELAHLLDGLGWRPRVIVGDQVDLASIDAAELVDHPEIRGLDFADR